MTDKKRKFRITALFIALAVLGGAALYCAIYMAALPSTTGKTVDAVELYENPEAYDLSEADGVAGIIIREDLEKTSAINTVTAVVFDFRGYDTLGESFVLLTAITGALVILRPFAAMKKKEEQDEEA